MSDDKCREMHFGIPAQKDKYYLVSYQWKTSAGNWIPDNLTLTRHPTEWLYEQLEERKREVILSFYSEITKEQYDKLSEWI